MQVLADRLEEVDCFRLGHDPKVLSLRQHDGDARERLKMPGFTGLDLAYTLGNRAQFTLFAGIKREQSVCLTPIGVSQHHRVNLKRAFSLGHAPSNQVFRSERLREQFLDGGVDANVPPGIHQQHAGRQSKFSHHLAA